MLRFLDDFDLLYLQRTAGNLRSRFEMTRNSGGRLRSKRQYRSPAQRLAKERISRSVERVDPCRTSTLPAIANIAYTQSTWDTVDVKCDGTPVCTVNTFLKTVRFDVHAVASINVTVVNDAVARFPPSVPSDTRVYSMKVDHTVDGRVLVKRFNVEYEHDYHILRVHNTTKLETIHGALNDNHGRTILFLCDNDLPSDLSDAIHGISVSMS